MPIHVDTQKIDPKAYETMLGFHRYVSNNGIDPKLRHLIDVRASQINGCAFCLDMHTREARQAGEAEHRLYALNAWRETPFFTPGERAALALTEHVTRIADGGVPSELDSELRESFSEAQIVGILMAIVHINAWNRIGVATGMQPSAR